MTIINTIKKFSLLAVALLLSLLAAEGLLRLSGKYDTHQERSGLNAPYISPYQPNASTGWAHVWAPNDSIAYSTAEFSYARKTNALGLSERPITPKGARKRILCLGDSYTEGAGAPADSSFPALLMKHSNYETWNAGILASDPVFALALTDELHLFENIQPDIVLLAMNIGDINDIIIRGGKERFIRVNGEKKIQYRNPPAWEDIYRRSILFRAVIHSLLGYNHLLIPKWNMKKLTAEAEEIISNTLTDLNASCIQHNATLILLIIPDMQELSRNTVSLPTVRKWCAENAVPVIDSKSCLRNQPNAYWLLDGHCTPGGYDLIAKCVTSQLAALH